MGVSGSGKSTIGKLISSNLNFHFLDADDFHPESNIQKMSQGIPLNDDDRLPWLIALQQELIKNPKSVLACSALKDSYRQILDPDSRYHWVYLSGNKELIWQRMQERSNHFMKAHMLDSQFETLEIPENAIHVEISKAPEEILMEIIDKINQERD